MKTTLKALAITILLFTSISSLYFADFKYSEYLIGELDRKNFELFRNEYNSGFARVESINSLEQKAKEIFGKDKVRVFKVRDSGKIIWPINHAGKNLWSVMNADESNSLLSGFDVYEGTSGSILGSINNLEYQANILNIKGSDETYLILYDRTNELQQKTLIISLSAAIILLAAIAVSWRIIRL